MVDDAVDRPLLGADRDRMEHQPEQAVRVGERPQLVVVEVPRRVVDAPATPVRADDRRSGDALEDLGEQAP